MQWKCKFCTFTSEKRAQLLKHYRINHGTYSRIAPIPCLHSDCPCTFKSFNALKVHLSKIHSQQSIVKSSTVPVCYKCHVCDFTEPCNESDYFGHLRSHLRNNEKVQCPFKDCVFETNVYSTFNAHKSKAHHHNRPGPEHFKLGIISSTQDSHTEENPAQPPIDSIDSEDECNLPEEQDNLDDTRQKLEHNLASLFLKMQTILHISDSATQEIIQQLNQIYLLSESLLSSTIQQIIVKHCGEANSSVVKELVRAVTDSNVMLQCTKEGGPLSTTNRRTSYFLREFPVVMPVEYKIDGDDQCYVYIPVIEMLQKLLKKTDVLDKVLGSGETSGRYSSYRDGTHYRNNSFFAEKDYKICLNLYIDDFEVANPLGTSRKKHKLCAVYWVLANLPAKNVSSLHTIQLALLCKTNVVRQHGYSKILHPLIEDLKCLEQQGVFVEQLGSCVRGSVLHVLADNLGAHSLAGFQESFRVNHPCRFCLATREDINMKEVRSGLFEMRTKEKHQQHVQDVLQDSTLVVQYGVKRSCPLSDNLKHFHAIGGFPPDLLHDLLEGVVPVEMALCLRKLIGKRYFTLESLNSAIKQFPYKFSDRTDQPQPIPQSYTKKTTIGGNGHENLTLLRLLPLLIGHTIAENDHTWEILMLLKDIVELSLSIKFADDTVEFLNCKISEHRALLQEVFPDFVLRPKHHYIEHYPQLIRMYGPLRNLWTMRFEGKHKFFKKVIRDAQNFKNVPLMLAKKHQMTMAYHMDAGFFFKPGIQMDRVCSSLVTGFPDNVQEYLHLRSPNCSTVLVSSSVTIDGIKYCPDMVVSVGSCSGLPEFMQIKQILAINTDIMFLCKPQTAWYIEHLRSYELCSLHSLQVILPSELNDPFPLAAYNIRGQFFVTLKHHICC
nr:uncharacterized protein LOC129420928 isoform X1 [Misgurnus anguillicaudatus]